MTNPILISTPFAAAGDKNTIQEAVPLEPNNPTWLTGFPTITSTPVSEGGLPPKRLDFNGLLNAVTDNIVHQTKGLGYEFDATYATKTGGYPLHAVLTLTNGDRVQSTVPNNIIDPNIDMTGWVKEKAASQVFDESGLTQQEINNKFTGAREVDLSYMKWPNGFDVSEILDASLKLSQVAPLYLILPHGDFIASTPVSTGDTGKGIILDLNGSTIKPTVGYSSPDWYFIDLQSTTDFPAILVNGVIDGSLRKQNLFEYTNIADFFTDATSGVHMKAKFVGMSNFELLNLYGQTTKFFCEKATVADVTIDNCGGHWYINDGYDMFGDLFYIGTEMALNGVVQGTFKNVTARAKHSDQYPENHQSGSPLTQIQYSRAGLVLENFGDTENIAYVSFENCDMRFVERGIHQEIGGITSHITFNNSRMDSCVLFGAYLTDVVNGYGFNSYFGFYGSSYNGSKGLSRAFGSSTSTGLLSVSNAYLNDKCVVEYFANDDCRMFGVTGNLEATDTVFKNVTGLWAENSKVKLRGCNVEVSKHFEGTYPSFSTIWDIKNTPIKYVGTDNSFKNYTAELDFTLENVAFENIYLSSVNSLNYDKFNKVSIVVNNDSTQSFKGTRWKAIKKNGTVVNFPSILWGANELLVKNDKYVFGSITATVGASLITTEIQDRIKDIGFGILVFKGHNSSDINFLNNIDPQAVGQGYYVAVVKYDYTLPNKTIRVSPTADVGSISVANYQVNVDNFFNITSLGSATTNVLYAVVPISELSTIPYVPDALNTYA